MSARYHPAPGYWRKGRRRLLWATIGVLDRLQRQAPEERAIAQHRVRLERLLTEALSPEAIARLWQQAGQGLDPTAETERLLEAVAPALQAEITTIRLEALGSTERRLGQPLTPGLRRQALDKGTEHGPSILDTLKERLARVVSQALASASTLPDFMRRLTQGWAAQVRERAEVIASTEWSYVAGEAALLAYRLLDIRWKAWFTVEDYRVCPTCRDNAAVGPILVEEAFPGGVHTVPQHPRCRCTVITYR